MGIPSRLFLDSSQNPLQEPLQQPLKEGPLLASLSGALIGILFEEPFNPPVLRIWGSSPGHLLGNPRLSRGPGVPSKAKRELQGFLKLGVPGFGVLYNKDPILLRVLY